MAEEKFTIAAIHENQNCVQITEDGLEGADRKNPNRPVSLISLNARQQVDSAVQRGLCYRRFTADITLDCNQMPPTDARLKCGELILVILPERKKCWPECELLQNQLPCPLKDGVRYAQVEHPGNLCINDIFMVL
jgi:hypothetical protein